MVATTLLQGQSAIDVQVNAALGRQAIDPRIYGSAYAEAAALSDLRIPVNRAGGNASTRYNWEVNASNRSADWYFESLPDGPGIAGDWADTIVNRTKAAGFDTIVTIPTIGWVAKLGPNRGRLASFAVSKYGAQTSVDPWFTDAGNGVSAATGQNITNDPNDASVPSTSAFQQRWVQHLVGRWGRAGSGGVRYYALDNEPSIWHNTHRDVRPNGATMDEVMAFTVDYATMVKNQDAGAVVLGPEEWGWSGFLYSGADLQWGARNGWSNLPDRAAHGNQDFVVWYLSQLRQREASSGRRLLDIFTLHYYPQGGEFSDDTSTGMQERRNRSTRALWDPNYVDESWINTQVRLIPRMKGWVAANYPNTKTGITEYNWGAEGHINGATTQADILGIFGREGLDMATRWGTPDPSTPTYKAIKLYRNYDGQGSGFGDVSVSAVAPNPDAVSAFAAERSSDGALTVMAINKALSGTPAVNIRLANFNAGATAQVWRLTSSNAINRLSDAAVSAGTLSTTLPAQSVTLFVVPAGGGGQNQAPAAPTNLRVLSGSGPATISPTGGTPQSTTVNSAFPTPLRATVWNASSAPVSGVAVTFAAPASAATGTFNGSSSVTVMTDANGVATAPTLTANGQPGSYTVTATVAGVGAASFAMTNSAVSSGGTWTRINLPVPVNTCDRTGVGSVLNDPVRPSDFYALVCQDNGPIAVVKSVDFGQTWTSVSTTTGMYGRPWGASIDPNPNRDPNTPPTMYTPAGYGALGLWKSTDGGVTWRNLLPKPTVFDPYSPFNLPPDVYHVVVVPGNSNHILISFHGYWKDSSDAGFGESLDGGQTWTVHRAPAGIGQSHYIVALDSSTWITVSQDAAGTWKTSTGGRAGGAPSTSAWRRVDPFEHFHGSFQHFWDAARGILYMPGLHGIRRTADRGETFSWAYQTTSYVSGLVATGNYIYSDYVHGPDLMRAPRSTGTGFASYGPVPTGMPEGSGPYGGAASFDGTRWIIVTGHQGSGIWRMVE